MSKLTKRPTIGETGLDRERVKDLCQFHRANAPGGRSMTARLIEALVDEVDRLNAERERVKQKISRGEVQNEPKRNERAAQALRVYCKSCGRKSIVAKHGQPCQSCGGERVPV